MATEQSDQPSGDRTETETPRRRSEAGLEEFLRDFDKNQAQAKADEELLEKVGNELEAQLKPLGVSMALIMAKGTPLIGRKTGGATSQRIMVFPQDDHQLLMGMTRLIRELRPDARVTVDLAAELSEPDKSERRVERVKMPAVD